MWFVNLSSLAVKWLNSKQDPKVTFEKDCINIRLGLATLILAG